jgi:hypothetical protein
MVANAFLPPADVTMTYQAAETSVPDCSAFLVIVDLLM